MPIRTTILIFLLATFALAQSGNAQTHVATVTKYTSSAVSNISKSLPSSSTNGNLIIVHLSYDNVARSVSSVTDTKGNTYTRINGPTTWNTTFRSELWYAYNITGGGAAINVTATLTGSSTSYMQIYISEYSGVLTTADPLDQKATRTGSSTSITVGPKTTAYGNELVYAVAIGASGTLSRGAGFNLRSSANENIVEDKNAPTPGSYNATFTSAGGNWVGEMATFRSASTLPVELVSFGARVLPDKSVKLDWVTSMELNNDYFDVQRSQDGASWKSIERIKGAGNSNNTISYTKADHTPLAGLSYYRLKQTDFDGRIKYSTVRTVRLEANGAKSKIKMYPNPADKYIAVEGNSSDLRAVCVFNYLGQPAANVKTSGENSGRVVLDLSLLSPGMYVLQTKSERFTFYKK